MTRPVVGPLWLGYWGRRNETRSAEVAFPQKNVGTEQVPRFSVRCNRLPIKDLAYVDTHCGMASETVVGMLKQPAPRHTQPTNECTGRYHCSEDIT